MKIFLKKSGLWMFLKYQGVLVFFWRGSWVKWQ